MSIAELRCVVKVLAAWLVAALLCLAVGAPAMKADADLSLPSGQMWASTGIPDASGVAVLTSASTTNLAPVLCTHGQGCELGVVKPLPGSTPSGYEAGQITALDNFQHITPPIELNVGDRVVFAVVYPQNSIVMVDYDASAMAVLYEAAAPPLTPSTGSGS